MHTAILPITYRSTEATPLDLLEIEQRPWSVYTGKVTKQEVVRVVSALLADRDYQSEIDCGLVGDQLVSILYAYPKIKGLDYRLYCDWGELSEPVIEEVELTEQVQFDLSTTATTQHPAVEILSAQWLDDCCDAEGTVLAAPQISIKDGSITSAAAVHATAMVRYRCERHTVILNAPRREGAIDQQWGSVVVAAYTGGTTHKVIDMPPGIASFAADPDAVCGGSWSGTVRESVADTYPPDPRGADLITETDYCKQTIIDEYTQDPQ
jgi:hypothetical protein